MPESALEHTSITQHLRTWPFHLGFPDAGPQAVANLQATDPALQDPDLATYIAGSQPLPDNLLSCFL